MLVFRSARTAMSRTFTLSKRLLNRFRRVAAPPSPLDRTLFNWSPRDQFTVRDLLNGGVCITGRAGSGKTSSSGKLLSKSIIRLSGSGGLILAAKPEDLEMWRGIFAASGRSDDLLVFGPGTPLRFNCLDYVLQMGGQTRDVTRCITVIGETLRSADTSGGESADFWEREQERMLYNAIQTIWLATGRVSAPDIQRFITAAPLSPEQIATKEWKAEFCGQTLQAAYTREKSPTEDHDLKLAFDYWLSEFPNMADKTRSSILTGVMGILHVFNVGTVRELISTTASVSPDDMLRGKWVIVNMPPSEWGDQGALVAAGWKYLTEKMVLRRHASADSNVITIWCDEAAQFVNSFDSMFITQCRSHLGALVFLTQSLHSYYGALKGEHGRHQADALLTNFSTRVMHAIGDAKTAEWASEMVGRELECFVSSSTPPAEDLFGSLVGGGGTTTSVSFQYQPAIQPKLLMHGLRTGGPANDMTCDAVVIRSAEPFHSGRNWMIVSFSQRD